MTGHNPQKPIVKGIKGQDLKYFFVVLKLVIIKLLAIEEKSTEF